MNSSTYTLHCIAITYVHTWVAPSLPQLLDCELFEVKNYASLIIISWTSTKKHRLARTMGISVFGMNVFEWKVPNVNSPASPELPDVQAWLKGFPGNCSNNKLTHCPTPSEWGFRRTTTWARRGRFSPHGLAEHRLRGSRVQD